MIGGKGDNIVLITGMGRSGTSIFARWLSEIGFNFGTGLNKTVNASGSVRSSTDTQHINPTGNFEDAGLMSLHVDLYKKNKMRSWLDVPLGYEWQIPFEQAAVFRNYMSQFNVINGPVAVKTLSLQVSCFLGSKRYLVLQFWLSIGTAQLLLIRL